MCTLRCDQVKQRSLSENKNIHQEFDARISLTFCAVGEFLNYLRGNFKLKFLI